MRIGELSRRTGVSVPTIKYYVREGLLPAGQLTSPNQASYDATHERRLKLIRALIDIGGLSVAGIREVLAAIDDRERPVHEMLGAAANRVVPRYTDEPGPGIAASRAAVEQLIERRGWRAAAGGQAGEALAVALAALAEVGHAEFTTVLDTYADAAERVADADLAYVAHSVAREDLVESTVIGTVLGDAIFGALRRLAHIDASARLFGTLTEASPGPEGAPPAPGPDADTAGRPG
ncbi:MerR family transcriptional regulator [Streptomyces purpureus]|uniref:MerR family transcriptional regulator n=1 Tax=Streptomyces purpureus TaxID=1951 RepID=A0A918H8R5_9ACTN|nr:MerR family transcriptional regulator [Streptomyces purpureus]GGT45378.1 MerR family transcriptional regulator [Streptomyces purpureus]